MDNNEQNLPSNLQLLREHVNNPALANMERARLDRLNTTIAKAANIVVSNIHDFLAQDRLEKKPREIDDTDSPNAQAAINAKMIDDEECWSGL